MQSSVMRSVTYPPRSTTVQNIGSNRIPPSAIRSRFGVELMRLP